MIFSYTDNMMRFEPDTYASAFIAAVAAVLARVIVSFFNCFHKIFDLITVHYTGKQEEINSKLRELLEHPESLGHHNVIGNDKRDGLKRFKDWAISIQASWEQVEGSTTNAYDPERIMKQHECAALIG